MGIKRSESSVSTTVSTNLRRDLVLNSWLATCLWNFQDSPSMLKIPWPRKSVSLERKVSPFSQFWKLDLRMCCTTAGLPEKTWRLEQERRRTKVAEGESRRISQNHWSWRSRLARMAKNEPTRGQDLGALELDLEVVRKKKKKKNRESKGIRMRRKMGNMPSACECGLVFHFLRCFLCLF